MKREQKPRKIRDTILILTNGKQSEKNYFSSITSHYKTMFTTEVKFINKQCDELVNYAIQLDKHQYNQIWCVFDIDNSLQEGHLVAAIKSAKRNNINLAYSNESFEVWLLFHLLEDVKTSLTRRNYIKMLNKLLSDGEKNFQYKKNDIELLKNKFIPEALNAMRRAKKSHQKLIVEHQNNNYNKDYPIWDWKSTTTVYQLIEALKLTPIDLE